MKRVFFGLMLAGLIGIPQSVSAQFSLGVVGIVNLSNLSVDVDGVDGTLGETNFGGGIVAELAFGEKLAVSVQPMYLKKGAGIKLKDVPDIEDFFGSNLETRLSFAFIEVPILLKYFITDDTARPYVIAGPSVGFLSTAEAVAKLDGESVTEDVTDEIESIDMSVVFGAGVEVPMGSALFFMDGRYALGLSNINKEENESIKTKGVQIALGARFPLGN